MGFGSREEKKIIIYKKVYLCIYERHVEMVYIQQIEVMKKKLWMGTLSKLAKPENTVLIRANVSSPSRCRTGQAMLILQGIRYIRHLCARYSGIVPDRAGACAQAEAIIRENAAIGGVDRLGLNKTRPHATMGWEGEDKPEIISMRSSEYSIGLNRTQPNSTMG